MHRTTLLVIAVLAVPNLAGCRKGDKAPQPTPVTQADVRPAPTAAIPIVAVDVPPGFNYPGLRAEIQAWADTWNTGKITPKAWDLWGGLTAGTGQRVDGAELPVWETWCGNEEVFTKTCGAGVRPSRRFHNARQLGHAGRPNDTRLASFNKFNPPMASYLMQPQPGPGGGTFSYIQLASLASLNQAWPPGTPISARKVQEAPYVPPSDGQQGLSAIETKPVMYLVKQTGLSPVPLWRGIEGAVSSPTSNCTKGPTAACHPSPKLWTTCVLIDPGKAGAPEAAPVAATPEQIAQVPANLTSGLSCKDYLYAPLSTIYSIQMNAQEAQEFNSAQGNGDAKAGDYAVLTAMHVNTKEIINWTWQTFWWQPGAEPPRGFPGTKAGMTDKVKGAWRNYAMCTAYKQTQGQASKNMVVCFNPFLETSSGIPDGVQSNCMSCHGNATVGSKVDKNGISTLSYPETYTAPIDFNTDPQFAKFTRTDFSWAIPTDAQPPVVQ